MRVAEQNRLASAHRHVQPDIQATLDWLDARLKDLDGDLQRRLRADGRPANVALTACMRKLLTILNAMLKAKTPWQPPAECRS